MDKPVILRNAVARYLELRREKVAENTYRNDAVAMVLLVNTLGLNLPLAELTRELFEDKFFGPAGKSYGMKASTFNAYLSRMRRFTQTCTAYQWIDHDPLLGVTGRRREPRPARRILAPAEMLALVELARSPRDRIAIALAANTGLRASEIASLRVGDVDLATDTLNVVIHKTVGVDAMPITAELHTELERWFEHYRRWFPVLAPDWYLIPQQNYAPHHGEDASMDYKLFPNKGVAQPYDIVKRALETLGVDTAQEGFHTIRRSVGRTYYELMKSKVGHESALVATAALLHHADIRQTQAYIGVQPERMERDTILRGQRFLTAATLRDWQRPAARHLRAVQQ